MVVNVSLHTKSTSTGVPVAQNFAHGLGVTPKAVIFVMSRGLAGGYQSNAFLCYGFTDGTNSFSVALASDGAAATTNATSGRRADPLHAVLWGETTPVIGTLTGLDSTNVSISWTANNNEAWNIAMLAIGGTSVQAKVVTWGTGTGTGTLAITGAGFRPATAIYIHDGRESAIVPSLGPDAHMGIGAVDDTQTAGQWYVFARNEDNQAAAQTLSDSNNDACVWKCDHDGIEDFKASHVSFDADGATVDIGTATGGSMSVGTLFLRGIRTDAFTFAKSTEAAPVAQSHGIDIAAQAVMLFSDCKTSAATIDDMRLAIGMADGTDEATMQVQDIDAADPTVAADFVSLTKGFAMSDNDTPTTTAEADISFSGTDVVLTWTTNNSNNTLLRGLAFGAELAGTPYYYNRRRRN